MGKWVHPTDNTFSGCDDMSCEYCPQLGATWAESPPTFSDDVLEKLYQDLGLGTSQSESDKVVQFSTYLDTVLEKNKPSKSKNIPFGKFASHYSTQKARGVHALKKQSYRYLQPRIGMVGGFPGVLYTLPHDGLELIDTLFAGPYPQEYFARPCPTVPRHGFVDSRRVKNADQLRKVWKETLEQDPNGEVLIMPCLTGKMSAVVTNAGVTWGNGNDGVTAGKDGHFLASPVADETWRGQLGTYSPIYGGTTFYDCWNRDMGNGQIPYIELVENMGTIVPVQLRAGPSQGVAKNFVPRETTVKRVMQPDIHAQDTAALLRWEDEVKKALEKNKGPDGLVVYYPRMALASHWAIHAIQNGICVWTEEQRPSKGDVLPLQSTVPPPLTQTQLMETSIYISQAQKLSLNTFNTKDVILTAMAAAHAMVFWNGSHAEQKLRAVAVEMITRFVAAACVGEARHFYSCGPGSRGLSKPDPEDFEDGREDDNYQEALNWWLKQKEEGKVVSHLPWDDLFGQGERYTPGRSQVYERLLLPMGLQRRRELLRLAALDFRMRGWSKDEDDSCCSYGGPKWARVCDAGIALIDATANFQQDANGVTWGKLLSAVNFAAHVAHNGGGVLGKWLCGEALNGIAAMPQLGLMNYFAGFVAVNGLYASKEEYN